MKQDWMSEEIYAWYLKEESARKRTLERRNSGGDGAMIAIKAQHPLTADGKPGPEYTARLERALLVKKMLEAEGKKVRILTFGGVHEGCEDVTLAEAGTKWLIDHGVDKKSIKPFNVVFSGNDEDRLAAEEFSRDENCTELHVVMSAGQWERCRLYFIFCGWQPEMHAITFLDQKPNHSTVCELWGSWAVPSFEKGPEAIEKATEEVRQRHLGNR